MDCDEADQIELEIKINSALCCLNAWKIIYTYLYNMYL